MNWLLPFDVIALAVLAWSASAALHGGHEVRDWRDVALTGALIVLRVFAFCGAVALIARPTPVAWWARGVLYSSGAIAAWIYDYRFGIARHLRMARGALHFRRNDKHGGRP